MKGKSADFKELRTTLQKSHFITGSVKMVLFPVTEELN